MTIVYAVIIFLLLIFIHELGHFIAAKACDVKVNEFSLGMGPLMFSKQGKETLYSVRWIPIGGFCAMEGEEEDSDDARALNRKSSLQKFAIFAAGPLMNGVLALIIMILIALVSGMPSTVIGTVDDGMPAKEAGILPGDVILSIDGEEINEWSDVGEIISEEKNSVDIMMERDGKQYSVSVTPKYSEKEKRYMLGITSKPVHSPGKACVQGVRATAGMTVVMYRVLAKLVTGEVSTKEISGPVGIVSVVSETSKKGFVYVAYLTALISLNLGVMNLLPFPALDGGRILFLVIRKITGKRVTDEMENRFHMAGMLLLFAFMIFITFQDIGRLIQ